MGGIQFIFFGIERRAVDVRENPLGEFCVIPQNETASPEHSEV